MTTSRTQQGGSTEVSCVRASTLRQIALIPSRTLLRSGRSLVSGVVSMRRSISRPSTPELAMSLQSSDVVPFERNGFVS